jgi:signal transduction histidine kinase
MRSSLRARFALLAGALVLIVAALIALTGYLTMRHAMLARAAQEARNQARQLAAMVDRAPPQTASANSNQVDIGDPALTHQSGGRFTIEVTSATGRLLQASVAAGRGTQLRLPAAFVSRCLRSGAAQTRVSTPPLTVACERIGPAGQALGAISVAAPLADVLSSLVTLRNALIIGILAGALLAGLLALLLAGRATRPIGRIARTAEGIRSGERPFGRIGYRADDELGELAAVLDACFAEQEQALERQRRFGADASHELRTPLAAIRANVELLRGWAAAEPAAREAALASLDQASRRAVRLVEDLLYLATLERAPFREHAPVRLDEVVVGVVREAARLRPDVAIRIARLDEVTVNGDALGLQQLLLNLIDNALRVSPAGATVTIRLLAGGGEVALSVDDEGPGFEPDQLERVFERFYTRATPGADRAGSGLGLAIARAIAADHRGGLSARNRPAGGARLELVLPVRVAARAGEPIRPDERH